MVLLSVSQVFHCFSTRKAHTSQAKPILLPNPLRFFFFVFLLRGLLFPLEPLACPLSLRLLSFYLEVDSLSGTDNLLAEAGNSISLGSGVEHPFQSPCIQDARRQSREFNLTNRKKTHMFKLTTCVSHFFLEKSAKLRSLTHTTLEIRKL